VSIKRAKDSFHQTVFRSVKGALKAPLFIPAPQICITMMKVCCMTTTLFHVLFSTSSVLGSVALRSSINNDKNNGVVNGELSKKYRLQEEDDRLRFHGMMKEEQKKEPLVVHTRRALVKEAKYSTPTSREEANHFESTMTMPDTMKALTRNRQLQDPCSSEQATMENCFASNFGCDWNCISAEEETLSQSTGGEITCSQYEAEICPYNAVCGCEMCGSAVADYFNCLDPTCNLDCAGGSATLMTPSLTLQPICAEELERVHACPYFDDFYSSCIDNAYALLEGSSCDVVAVSMCPQIHAYCGNGACGESLEGVSSILTCVEMFRFFTLLATQSPPMSLLGTK
jgi:hypothetical protein